MPYGFIIHFALKQKPSLRTCMCSLTYITMDTAIKHTYYWIWVWDLLAKMLSGQLNAVLLGQNIEPILTVQDNNQAAGMSHWNTLLATTSVDDGNAKILTSLIGHMDDIIQWWYNHCNITWPQYHVPWKWYIIEISCVISKPLLEHTLKHK